MSFHSHPKVIKSSRMFCYENGTSGISYVPFPAYTTYFHPFNNGCDEEYNCEEPIDMSIKPKPQTPQNDIKSCSSNKLKTVNDASSSLMISSYSDSSLNRPSVITRFDSCYESGSLLPPPLYESVKKNQLCNKINIKNAVMTETEENSCLNRKTFSDSVDPEIEEHFRRSLGINYNDFLVSELKAPVNEPQDSVDDHFTKALGQTWLKLKNENKSVNTLPAGSRPLKHPSLSYILSQSESEGYTPNLHNSATSVSNSNLLDHHHRNKLNCSSKNNYNNDICVSSISKSFTNCGNIYNKINNATQSDK